jgi:hypothetical protein
MPGDELFAPLPYSWGWAVLGAALLLVGVAAVVLWIAAPGRRGRRAEPSVPAPPPAHATATSDPFAAARAASLAALDRIRARHGAGELDERAVHQAVAAELRRFAAARLGRPTDALTVRELHDLAGMTRDAHDVLDATVAPSFGTQADVDRADAGQALADARTLVEVW